MNRRTPAASSQLTEVPIDVARMMAPAFGSRRLMTHDVDHHSRFTAHAIEHAPSRVDYRDEVLRHRRFCAGSLNLYREEAVLA